jgi:hypothetical protein
MIAGRVAYQTAGARWVKYDTSSAQAKLRNVPTMVYSARRLRASTLPPLH